MVEGLVWGWDLILSYAYWVGYITAIVHSIVTTFEVLGDPNRRRILELLRDGERPVGDLVAALRISQPGVSKHLRVLRTAGFVSVRPDAQRRMYRVRFEPLIELDAWLDPYRQVWRERLDALERRLDDMEVM